MNGHQIGNFEQRFDQEKKKSFQDEHIDRDVEQKKAEPESEGSGEAEDEVRLAVTVGYHDDLFEEDQVEREVRCGFVVKRVFAVVECLL